jgi:hypothetical protein
MNDLEYLNQISAKTNQPAKTGLFDKKMKIVLGALGGVIILAIILMSVIGNSSDSKSNVSSELSRLYTRATELNKTITNYNRSVSHSTLRSNGAQLSTLLTEVTANASTYLSKNLGIETKKLAMTEKDSANIKKLNADLEKARLNGLLDRTYAHEMDYQIDYLLIIEESIYKKTSESYLKAFIESSTSSLNLLKESFHNYSESD